MLLYIQKIYSAGTNEKSDFLSYSSSTSRWKPWRWMRLNLMVRDIYINSNLNSLTKFTTSSRSTKFKYILQWNIYQMITNITPISTRISLSYAMEMEQNIPFWVWQKVSGNWDNNTIRIPQCRESHCTTNPASSFVMFRICSYWKDLWNCQHNNNWRCSCWFWRWRKLQCIKKTCPQNWWEKQLEFSTCLK